MKLNPLGWLFGGSGGGGVTADEVAAAYWAHKERPMLLTFYDADWNCIASRLMPNPDLGAGISMEHADRADFWGIDLAQMEAAAWLTITETAEVIAVNRRKENDQ